MTENASNILKAINTLDKAMPTIYALGMLAVAYAFVCCHCA